MPLVPIRNLGQYGVNTDLDSLDLPINVFSMANNVRFADAKITRGPVFAKLGENDINTAPRWGFGYNLMGSQAVYMVMNQNGTVATVSPANPNSPLNYTDVSVAGFTPSDQTLNFTTSMLSGVVYVNRSDRVPWSRVPTANQFTTLPNWDSTWRCNALRSFNGCLVAINVTKGAFSYPTMVKTSDFAAYGTVPGSWTASLTNSATENVLSDITDPLIDGWPLKDRFILYTPYETWAMYKTGDQFIYGYQKMFTDYGVISQNCIAETNNTHFVFGSNDLWTHDGFTPKSIAAGRVRNFVFNNLVRSQAYQFFVWSNPKLNEIMFCYVSTDPYCAFPVNDTIGYPGCNRAAVYNWLYDTWTFYDLPYIVAGGIGQLFTGTGGITYPDTSPQTYETISGAYQVVSDSTRMYNLCIGRGGSVINQTLPLQTLGSWNTSTHMYSMETLENVVGLGKLVPVTNAPVYVENPYIDMDEVLKELRGYKVVTSMYPEARVDNVSNPMTFWWGSVDYSGQQPVYDDPMTFDGRENYKLDFNAPGRYLSFKMAMGNPPQKFTWSGMDIHYKVFGHR